MDYSLDSSPPEVEILTGDEPPMYSMNKFEARSFVEMLQPSFRSIKMEPDNHNIRFVHGLRSAWKGLPLDEKKPHYQERDVRNYLKLFFETKSGADPTPRNMDMAFSTPWRLAVYELWNQLFVHIMKFLPGAAPDVGHFHAPNHNILPITQSFDKIFSTDVLIVPAFLKPGIKITMLEKPKSESQPARIWGTFSSEGEYDVWFLKTGVAVKFEVEGEKADKESLKAVLIYGVVCNELHSNTLARRQRATVSSRTSATSRLPLENLDDWY